MRRISLPEANQIVAILDIFGNLDICKFITTSDGDWFFDNMIDCVYHKDEIVKWKAIDV